jgi:hypothetical protein
MAQTRKLTLYRDDSTVQVVYEHVKAVFWTAGNTVLVVSQYTTDDGDAHRYIHWPRERFCWFKDEPTAAETDGTNTGGKTK